jgi:hypothetical protein
MARHCAAAPAAGPVRFLRPDRLLLLPSWCAPRRADAVQVIGTAAAAALTGAGYGRISRELGVPAATVRSWLRRLRSRAEEMRQHAMFQLGLIGGLADPALPVPSGLPLGNALSVHLVLGQHGAQMWLAEDQHTVKGVLSVGCRRGGRRSHSPAEPGQRCAGFWRRWPGRRRQRRG